MRSSPLRQRKLKPERRSFALLAVNPKRHIMLLQNTPDNRQTQSAADNCPLMRLLRAVVAIPYQRQFLRRNALAAVVNRQAHHLADDLLMDFDRLVLARVRQRIAD